MYLKKHNNISHHPPAQPYLTELRLPGHRALFMRIIGVDCATQGENVGLALAHFAAERPSLIRSIVCSDKEPVARTMPTGYAPAMVCSSLSTRRWGGPPPLGILW